MAGATETAGHQTDLASFSPTSSAVKLPVPPGKNHRNSAEDRSPALTARSQGRSWREAGAVVPIPEPRTWTLMLLGFVFLGYAVYRRKEKSRLEVTA